ncbi:MAG: hypothetical protein K2K31_00740, partial [Clostridia bacterium]|nr:hypothetical protein [Clostridia bacterium]
IGLSYIFPLNSKMMEEKGLSEDERMIFRFYLSSYVNALAKVNRDKNVDGVEVGYCTYIADVDGIGFSISFDSLDTQKEFFGVNDDESQDENESKTETSGFFMKKISLKTSFPISESSAQSLKDVCLLAVNSTCESVKISPDRKAVMQSVFEDSIFIYDFASYSSTLKSDNMYEANGVKHNIFFKTMDQLKNDSIIEFYVTGPNHAVWYVSALVLVCVGISVTFMVYKIKTKNKNLKT